MHYRSTRQSDLVPASGIFSVANGSPWLLTAEGAAVHASGETAVIADVHLGYEWARAHGGDSLPPHSLAETLAKLDSLLARVKIARLIVAGDLVETPRPCPRTARDVRALVSWLGGRGVTPLFLRGNHDPARVPPLPSSIVVDGWTVLHGDRALPDGPCMFGHHHPALKAGGLVAACFLVGRRSIALPAFSPNAAGLDVISGRLPDALRREPLRCVAALGGELLDFGPLSVLAAKIAGS